MSNLRGFTLIELVIAMVIAGIMVAIALPAYQTTVRKSSRQVATRTLIELSARQEALRAGPRRSYADDFEDLVDIAGTTVYVDRAGNFTAAQQADSLFEIELDDLVSAGGVTTAYTLVATAVGRQQKDSECTAMSLRSTGLRTATGSAADPVRACWSG